MSADVKIFGRVRQLLQGLDQGSVGDDEQITLNEQFEQLVAIATSPYGEIVKIGRSFEIHTTSALAAVVAVPTTANMLSIWNGEPDGGRCLVIDRVWGLMVAGTAAAGQGALIGCLGQTRVASLTSAALAINANNGNGGKDTKVVNSTAVLDAITGVAANWRALPGQTGGQRSAPRRPRASTSTLRSTAASSCRPAGSSRYTFSPMSSVRLSPAGSSGTSGTCGSANTRA